MANSSYRKTYSNRKITYSNKQKESGENLLFAIGGGIIIGIILICTIGGIVALMPGITLTSIINLILSNNYGKTLAINRMWGFSLTFSIILLAYTYYKYKADFWKKYGLIAISLFIVGVLFSLFYPDNILFFTVVEMFPYIEKWIM